MVCVSGGVIYASLSLILCSYFTGVHGRNCDELGVTLYDTFGCTAKSHDADGCASEYECNFPTDKDTCFFKGNHYKVGDTVVPHGAPCNGDCTCTDTPQGAAFSCQGPSRCNMTGMHDAELEPGCYRSYELGKCCPIGKKCHGKDEIHKCVVDGKEYDEGVGFQAKDKCQYCVCTRAGPVCHATACAEWAQLFLGDDIRKNCAPVYLKDLSYPEGLLCCTHMFYCPKGTEVIKSSEIPNPDGKSCKFGNKILNLGDRFEVSVGPAIISWDIECECVIPPLVTCKERKPTGATSTENELTNNKP